MTPRIYVAGPYSASCKTVIRKNIARADRAGRYLLGLGLAPFIPHNNTAGWENDMTLRYEDFMALDLAWLEVAEAIYMLRGWEKSRGAVMEHNRAIDLGIVIIYQGADDEEKKLKELIETEAK